MKVKKSMLASVIALCVAVPGSGSLQASNAPRLYPTPSADPVTTTTVPRTTAAKTVVWSSQTVTAGSKVKLSKVVSVKVKGKSSYRASGACSLRKGVLSFNLTGKCRISVSVKLKSNGKVLRSSKVVTVKAKQFSVPQMKLTGTPQEQANQVVSAAEKVAAISDFKKWSVALHQLNLSLVSYGVEVVWDPNGVGSNIYQISLGDQRACFLWTEVNPNVSDDMYLKPHSCAK